MKYKENDRVRVYSNAIGTTTGTVSDVYKEAIRVIGDNGTTVLAHPKQCRKLKNKLAKTVVV